MSSCHYCLLTKSLQSCPALCNPMDCSPSGSSVHGSLKARILEWIAISFFRDSFPPRDWTCVSWVSYIAGSFFTTSTTWECQHYISINQNKNKNRKQQDKPVPSLLLAPCNEGWLPLVFIIVHAQSLSHVQLFETPWTIACPAPLSMEFLTRILEWAASSSRGSSQPRDRIHISCVSCIGRRILYHWATWEATGDLNYSNKTNFGTMYVGAVSYPKYINYNDCILNGHHYESLGL